jgi:hypothetical protein
MILIRENERKRGLASHRVSCGGKFQRCFSEMRSDRCGNLLTRYRSTEYARRSRTTCLAPTRRFLRPALNYIVQVLRDSIADLNGNPTDLASAKR